MNIPVSTAIIDGIATLTLDDPTSEVNTITPVWVEEMRKAFQALAADDGIHGIIITSAKPGFLAGADLKFILAKCEQVSQVEAFEFSQAVSQLFRFIETCGKPVVALINGFALGGGYELALACSYRIIANDPGAIVGLPEVNVGLLPGAGGTQRLPRLIGVEAALDALLSGRTFRDEAAVATGLVDKLLPRDELHGAAVEWLAGKPDPVKPWDKRGFILARSEGLIDHQTANFFSRKTAELRAQYGDNYPAPIAILASVFEGIQLPIDRALGVESRNFAKLLVDPVARNTIRTMFINKPAAEKGAMRPAHVPITKFQKIGILGAGMMGAGITYSAALAGIEVVLLDITVEAASRGKEYSQKLVASSIKRGRMAKEAGQGLLDRIKPTDSYADLEGCDFVIENVFEDRAIKGDVTRKAAAVVGPHCYFASNTSTLPITGLAEAFPRQSDFIGMHFFSPVDRMPLVEIIMGKLTGQEALAKAIDFVAQIRKTPIVVQDSRGFYTSRVFLSFVHEGAELLNDGVAPALIENGAKAAGMAVGPLAVLDEVSLELPIKIDRQAEKEEPAYSRPGSLSVLEKMAEQLGRPGRKGGGGFYDYPEKGVKRLWPQLIDHFPMADVQPAIDEVKKRLLYRQALETARCLEEGILISEADGDIGSILGWGFPTWTGGTLSLIRTVGARSFVEDCDALAEKFGERFRPPANLRQLAADDRSSSTGTRA